MGWNCICWLAPCYQIVWWAAHGRTPLALRYSVCICSRAAATAAPPLCLQDRFSSRYKGVLKGRPAASGTAAKPVA